jgi:hypothetical protein
MCSGLRAISLPHSTARERLAAADPGNAGWQRNLSVTHGRIGDVLQAQAISLPRSTAIRPISRSWSAWPPPIPEMPAGSATSP